MAAPADVVEGVFGRVAEFAPEFVGDNAVEAGAFVDFVEVGEGLALEEFLAGGFVEDGRAVDVVEEAFDEIGGGSLGCGIRCWTMTVSGICRLSG